MSVPPHRCATTPRLTAALTALAAVLTVLAAVLTVLAALTVLLAVVALQCHRQPTWQRAVALQRWPAGHSVVQSPAAPALAPR